MEYDRDQVDDMVLALLYLTTSRDQYGARAWKGLDATVLDRLHQKGYIGDPRGKTPSLPLTEAGAKRSKELFFEHFATKE